MKSFISLLILLLTLTFTSPSLSNETCKTQVRSRLLDGTILNNISLSVLLIPPSPGGAESSNTQNGTVLVLTDIAEAFYRKVEVSASKEQSKGNLAFFEIWPCIEISPESKILDLTLASRTGSANEVRRLKNDQSIIAPNSFRESLRAFTTTMGTALARHEKRADSTRKLNDLFSTYFALRAFDHLSKKSENIILSRSSEVEKIRAWHLELLSEIDVNRIPSRAIRADIRTVGSELNNLANMYSKYRRKILSNKDSNPKLAYDTYKRFMHKLLSEPESSDLRTALRLSEALMTQELNSLAGKLISAKTTELKLRTKIAFDQTRLNSQFLKKFEDYKTKSPGTQRLADQIGRDKAYFETISRESRL